MNVNRVNNNNVINLYNKTKRVGETKQIEAKKDSLEISTVGKSLSPYSLEDKYVNPDEKIEALRNQISMGTYKSDSTLVAKKIIDVIKGREI